MEQGMVKQREWGYKGLKNFGTATETKREQQEDGKKGEGETGICIIWE